MKWISLLSLTLAVVAEAAPDTLSDLRRQIEEQERQILQLEVENSRLRYMLTEADHHEGDPLYGTEVSGRPGGGITVEPDLGESHVVREGDTLSEIAAAWEVNMNDLVSLNQLEDPSAIRPGQRLRLPEPRTVKTPAPVEEPRAIVHQHHTIGAGENLYRISMHYDVALDELLAANPAIHPRKLRVGQRVRIPPSGPMLAGGR